MYTKQGQVKSKLFDQLRSALFYTNKCLDATKATSDTFFNEISYQVDITKLYRLKDTCLNDENMTYCPLLLEIINEEIIKAWNGNRYLLQVWNKKGMKVYEVSLKFPTRCWAICPDTFLYIPHHKDNDSQYLHIVNLDKNNQTLLISKEAISKETKYMYYDKEILYSANDQVLTYVKLQQRLSSGDTQNDQAVVVDCTQLKVRKIESQLKIHGILKTRWNNIIVIFETNDNQLDSNKFVIENIEDDTLHNYHFVQSNEILPRSTFSLDPIIKNVIINGGIFMISLRKSGKFDLYYKFRRVNSPESKYATDVAMSFNTLYFKMTDKSIHSFEHRNDGDIDFSAAERMTDPNATEIFDGIQNSFVSNYLNLYQDFKIFNVDKKVTFLLLVHGNFLSFYDLNSEKWIRHVQYKEGDILNLFQIKNKEDKVVIGVILQNGTIYIDNFIFNDHDKIVMSQQPANIQITEEIVKIYEDNEISSRVLFIVVKSQGNCILKCLYKDKLHTLKGFDFAIENDFNFVKLAEEMKSVYLIQQKNKIMRFILVEDSDKTPRLKLEQMITAEEELKEKVHSAIFGKDEDTMMFFTESRIILSYKDQNQSKLIIKDKQNVMGVWKCTHKTIYALCADKDGQKGLRLYDIESIIKKKDISSVVLKDVSVGFNGNLQYCSDNRRFIMLEAISKILVFPQLHLNSIRFMGMLNFDGYYAYKTVNDKYIALGKDHILYTWSLISGKLINQFKLADEYDYSGYEIAQYSFEEKMRNRVLLRSREEITDVKIDNYYEPFQLQKNIDKQITYCQNQKKSIQKWILLEIRNETQVREYHFTYPHLSKYQCNFFFNDQVTMMIAWSTLDIYLYKFHHKASNYFQVSLQFIKKFDVWPSQFNDEFCDADTNFLQILSPDFSQMIVPRKQLGYVTIRDTITGMELHKIPQWIMDIRDPKESKLIMNRFKWINNSSFMIVNSEGIEKIFDYSSGKFVEKAINVIPFWSKEDWDESQRYYIVKKDIPIENTCDLLKQKYRNYKSMYQMHQGLDRIKYYSALLTSGYTVSSLSFSYFHWSLIEQIQNGLMSIDDIDDDILETLLFIILPGGSTLLHRLCLASMDDELLKLLKRSQPNKDEMRDIKMYVPVIPNFDGKTALHICCERGNFKIVDHILQYIQYYPMDHCSRPIKDLLAVFIREDIPSLLDFLGNRCIQNEQIKQITKGNVQKELKGAIEASLWYDKKHIEQRLFKNDGVEPRIKCEFFDIPGIYHFNDCQFVSFYEALAASNNYDLFMKKAIQKIIDFNFKIVKRYSIIYLFLPFMAFIITFVVYLKIVFQMRYEVDQDVISFWKPIDRALLLLLGCFAVYQLQNEYKQLRSDGVAYFLSIWNYIDIVPPFGICLMISLNLYEPGIDFDHVFELCVHSIATFFMWFKLLYFLRIFKNTSYLIRMIIEVIYDMKAFMLVWLISILAFSDSFLGLSLANPPDTKFIMGFIDSFTFTYRLILGDWDTKDFGNVALPLVWILFLLCTIFNLIVMLNLLIAIISETFSRVNGNAISTGYKEMASLISENQYIVPEHVKNSYAEENRYIMIVTKLGTEDIEVFDPVFDKISDMYTDFKVMKSMVEGRQDKLKLQLDRIEERVKRNEEQNENMKEEMQETNRKLMLYMQGMAKSMNIRVNEDEGKRKGKNA